MILRLVSSITLFFTLSFAQSYPKSFAQLAMPLYKSSLEMQRYSDIEAIRDAIQNYKVNIDSTISLGFEVDKSSDKLKTKEYLLELRRLQKEYDYLLHLLHKTIETSIDEDNYEEFLVLLSYDFDGFLRNSSLRSRVMKFYSKHRDAKSSKLLDKKIKDKKILDKTTKEFYNEPVKSTYDSSSKQNQSKKSVTIDVEQEGNYIFVSFKNKNPYDVTLSIKPKYKNIAVIKKTPDVVVVKAGSTLKYAKLKMDGIEVSYRFYYSWIVGNKDAVHDDNYIYRLPYTKGTSHIVSQGFNGRFTHKGRSRYAIDFAMPVGTKIYASRGGVVIKTKSDSNIGGMDKKFASSGNYVTIAHDDGTMAIYYHLKKNGVIVSIRDKVQRGTHIGYSGNTGRSSGPHLHFAVFSAASASATQTIMIKLKSYQEDIVYLPVRGRYYTAY